jgi:hypothetical protein
MARGPKAMEGRAATARGLRRQRGGRGWVARGREGGGALVARQERVEVVGNWGTFGTSFAGMSPALWCLVSCALELVVRQLQH